jgi:hypothetical protein
VTKKSYYYTCSDIHRKTRLEIPEYWKKWFLEKTVTCGESSFRHLRRWLSFSSSRIPRTGTRY